MNQPQIDLIHSYPLRPTGTQQAYQKLLEQENGLRQQRASLRRTLLQDGILHVEVRYEGSGDSGEISSVLATKQTSSPSLPSLSVDDPIILTSQIQEKIQVLFWDLAYNTHQGFEINEGAQGTITWELEPDQMILAHEENLRYPFDDEGETYELTEDDVRFYPDMEIDDSQMEIIQRNQSRFFT